MSQEAVTYSHCLKVDWELNIVFCTNYKNNTILLGYAAPKFQSPYLNINFLKFQPISINRKRLPNLSKDYKR